MRVIDQLAFYKTEIGNHEHAVFSLRVQRRCAVAAGAVYGLSL
jgi:hypothetical protein